MNNTLDYFVPKVEGKRVTFSRGTRDTFNSQVSNEVAIVNAATLEEPTERESFQLHKNLSTYRVNRAPKVPVFDRASIQAPTSTSKIISFWEGYVNAVYQDQGYFSATLIDLKQADFNSESEREPDHQAEFDIAEVSEFDRDLIVPGAVFYWSITYITSVSRQINTNSDIRFRRLPLWTKFELDAAHASSESLAKLFGI